MNGVKEKLLEEIEKWKESALNNPYDYVDVRDILGVDFGKADELVNILHSTNFIPDAMLNAIESCESIYEIIYVFFTLGKMLGMIMSPEVKTPTSTPPMPIIMPTPMTDRKPDQLTSGNNAKMFLRLFKQNPNDFEKFLDEFLASIDVDKSPSNIYDWCLEAKGVVRKYKLDTKSFTYGFIMGKVLKQIELWVAYESNPLIWLDLSVWNPLDNYRMWKSIRDSVKSSGSKKKKN